MDGRGVVDDLVEHDPGLARPHPEVPLWYANTVGKGYSTGWVDLAPGYSVPPKFDQGAGKLPSGTFGVELTFGRSMAERSAGRRVALVKVSRGGTSLLRDWNPDLDDEDALYPTLIQTVRTAQAELAANGHVARLRGVVWHQGESDRKARRYAEHLETFIARVREDLDKPELPFVIGEVFDNGKRDLVRQAQRDVARRVPATLVVPSDGLATFEGTHFTSESILLLGERFARAMLGLRAHAPDAAAASIEKPNILLILTDQQFADAMSCAGTPGLQTPGMDSIAARGVRFTNAYVNLPVCMPQRYAMMTGRLPSTRRLADPDHKPTVSLGNQAREAGYVTAYYGKWHVQDKTFEREDTEHAGFEHEGGGNDERMTDRAIRFFAQHKDNPDQAPFFAVVSYYNPHDICEWGRKKAGFTERIDMKNGDVDIDPPLEVCPPLPENFKINPDEAEAVSERRRATKKGVPNAQNLAMSFTPDDWRQYRWAYHRFVELVDTQIVRLLESLEEHGLSENTVIVFTSDHGDGYAAHRWHQKSILYDESCRVPFIVSAPAGPRRNETDARLISVGIDLMATVSDIAGVEMPEGPYYGKSALPFVIDAKSRAPAHRYVVSEAEVTADSGEHFEGRAIRTERFKYHAWNRGENREQLFDMINDPGETTNLANLWEYAEPLGAHRAFLREWLEETDDTYTPNPDLLKATNSPPR